MSAIWASWSPDWSLYDKVDFDGINKVIYVHPEVTSLDIRQDVYTSWVDWVSLRDNLKFKSAIRVSGLDPIGSGAYTGDVYFLINGWKLSVNLQRVKITGVLYSDDFDTAYYTETLSPQYPATVAALVNTIAPVVTVDGLVVPTAQEIRQEMDTNSTKLTQIKQTVESLPTNSLTLVDIESSTVLAKSNQIQQASTIATAVRTELTPELSKIMAMESNPGLTPTQATMLIEIYALMGLDPTKPLVVTESGRTAGNISQAINSTPSETIVTRS